MKSKEFEGKISVLNVIDLEFVSGGGFWKQVGYEVGVAVAEVENFFEEGVQGFYNIATTGSPH